MGLNAALGGGAAPQVPVQAIGRAGVGGVADPVGRLVHDIERSHGADAAEVAGADELDHAPVVVAGMDLGANLADDAVPGHGVTNGQAFAQVQRHRFLQVDVFAGGTRRDRLERVPVRRAGDDHGVEIRLLQHLPIIRIGPTGLPELGHDRIPAAFPGIAGARDHHVRVFRAVVEIGPAHSAAADQAQTNAFAGRRLAIRAQRGSRDKIRQRDGRRGEFEEIPARG